MRHGVIALASISQNAIALSRALLISMAMAVVSGCTTTLDSDNSAQGVSVDGLKHSDDSECASYARLHSAVKIFGDAYKWWELARGRYERHTEPTAGSIMVLYGYAGPSRGHVAIVRNLNSSRTITVDHANWLNDGAIFLSDPVMDVSEKNDWSEIRVWNIRTGHWGGRIYSVRGFIGPDRALYAVRAYETELGF
jgi:surface antigen